MSSKLYKAYTLHIVSASTVTPDIYSDTIASFGTFPAGNYRIAYVNGAMKYSPDRQWCVNLTDSNGFFIYYFGPPVPDFQVPCNQIQYSTQAACEAANAGAHIDFYHTGGEIGVFLEDEPIYVDNVAGSPNPTFSLVAL